MLNSVIDIVNQIRSFFEGDAWVSLVFVALFLSAIFWVLCLIGIAVFYYRDYRYKSHYEQIYPVLRDFIYEHVLLGTTVRHFPIDRLKLKLDKSIVRKVVRRVLQEFIFTIGGEKGKSMRNLFNEMGFDREAQYELRHASKHTEAAVRSLSDLALMQVPVKDTIVDDLIKSPKKEIRVATYKYLLQVRGEESFDYVFDSIMEISELDALDIYQAIILTDYVGEYPFYRWLDPKKSFAVNSLFMNLMVHYQQLDGDALWRLIDAKEDETTVLKAVNTLGKLLARKSEERLQVLYVESENEKLKVEIVKAIGRLGNGKSLDLLVRIFEDGESSTYLKRHVYRSLLAQRPYSRYLLHKLEENVGHKNIRIIRYVSHPMVHYI